MNEIGPGIVHWTARHPRIGVDVSSYLLPEERVLLDPMLPAGGIDAVEGFARPRAILLTNRHHYRDSDDFVAAFGCSVHCHRSGLHEFGPGTDVEPFDFGDELPGGIVAHEVGAICPDESALHVPARRALACADGLIHYGGEPGFVPDDLMGDDPEEVKDGLRGAYARLAELDVENLLLAHGKPIVGGAREVLARIGAGAA